MLKHLLFLLGLLLIALGGTAQPGIPVDHHTGKPNIFIPLWELQEGDVQVPLSLYYDASGVKLADEAGWVGLKWLLSGQGSVSRVVNGLPDDLMETSAYMRSGWLYNNNYSLITDGFSNPATSGCDGAAWESIKGAMEYLTDKEPDVFIIDAPGLSGRFLFDNNGVPKPLPYQQLKIVPTFNTAGNITEFTITNNQGTTYTFGNRNEAALDNSLESTTRSVELLGNEAMDVEFFKPTFAYYKEPVTYNSKWNLMKIESSSGKKVTYKYQTHADIRGSFLDYEETQESKVLYRRCNTQAADCEGRTEYVIKVKTTTSVLSEISTSTTKIEFVSGGSHDNSNKQDISLKTIRVVPLGSIVPVKEFFFSYTKANSIQKNNLNEIVPGNYVRKFLSEVVEQVDCLRKPPYQFSYNELAYTPEAGHIVQLPDPGATEQDLWGFYNSNPLKTLAPKLYVYPSMSGANRYRTVPLTAYTGEQVILDGADRSVNAARITNGSLKQVTYPTGGTLEFEFQPTTYYDAAGQEIATGGLRIKTLSAIRREIPNDPASLKKVKLKEFLYTDPATGLSSGILMTLPGVAFPSTYFRPISSSTNILTFEELQDGNYSSTDKWDYLTVRAAFDLSANDLWNAQPVVYGYVTEKLPGNGRTQYQYDVSGKWGDQQAGDWSATKTLITSKKAGSPLTCPTLAYLNADYYAFPFPASTNSERGTLKRIDYYSETGTPVKEVSYTYQQISDATGATNIYGLKFERLPSYYTTTTYRQLSTGDVMEIVKEHAGEPIFLYGRYKLLANTAKVPQTQVVSIIDANGKKLTTTTSFTYEQGLLTKVGMTGPDGNMQQKYYRYPKDFSIAANATTPADEASSMIRRMKEKFMFGTVLEQISTVKLPGKTEIVTSAGLATFNSFGKSDKVYPAATFELKTGKGTQYSAFVPAATQNTGSGYVFQQHPGYEAVYRVQGYDSWDKALGMTEPVSQRTISHHFGYNYALPVAEITDARADAVVFSNFETPLNFEFKITNALYGEGRTGEKGLHLQPGQLLYRDNIRNGASSHYMLTAWVKATDPVNTSGTLTVRVKTTGGTVVENPFTYAAAIDKWTLLQMQVPVTSVGLEQLYRAEIQSTKAMLVDDIAFYPANASLSTQTFAPLIGKTSVTDPKGKTNYFDYDLLGNLETTRDDERNILQHNKYVYYNEKGGLQADIAINGDLFWSGTYYDGTSIPFTAKPLNCQISGVTYTWNFGDGSAETTGENVSHVYPSIGGEKDIRYTITLTAYHKDFGYYKTTRNIYIRTAPLNVSICANGPVSYDSCNLSEFTLGACTSGTVTSGNASTTYTATVSNCSGPITYKWQTRLYGQEYAEWKDIPNATGSSVTLAGPSSYEVRCLVTGCNSRGESEALSHIVYNGVICEDDLVGH